MIVTLINRDSKNKIRVVELSYEKSEIGFTIHRETYQLNGKHTVQPDIIITKGKAKRSIEEQLELEFNAHLKKYLDKGYIQLEGCLSDYSESLLNSLIPSIPTSSSGSIKPMLAKQYQDVNPKIFENDFLGSRKINGVRCLIHLEDGCLKSTSRGSITYDMAISHILHHPKLISLFEKFPGLILDGEIFKFGWPLNKISGLCRLQTVVPEHFDLEFYLYDIVDINKDFKSRLDLIHTIKEYLSIGFIPEKQFDEQELHIQCVPHEPVQSLNKIFNLHDKYVSEGWEGLVIRDPKAVYYPGKRGNFMIKCKKYFEKEYLIKGITEGLREEDLCFLMETPNGHTFNAKPIGDRSQKQLYRESIQDLIGKMGTIKYFEMSGANTDIPQQPIFIGVRDYED